MKRLVLVVLAVSMAFPLVSCRARRTFFVDAAPLAADTTWVDAAPDATVVVPASAGFDVPPAIAALPDGVRAAAPFPPAPARLADVPASGPPAGVARPDDEPPSAQDASAPGARPAAAATAQDGGDLLQRAREQAMAEAGQRKALIDSALAKARAAMEEGDLDAARGFYDDVLGLDPNHQEARKGAELLANDRARHAGEFLREQRGVEIVRRQQAASEVRNYLERGRTHEAREDYEAAIKEYQKALAIVSWYTDQRDFGVDAARIRDLIENARHKADVARRQQRQEQVRAAQSERERELIGERERRLGTIQSYFEQANLSFQRGEYDLAREYASAILRWDPQNCDAQRLIAISYDAEHLRNQERARRLFDDQWKEVFEGMERAVLPQVKTVVFPDDWLENIAKRGPRVVGETGDGEDATATAILATLESKRVKGLIWEEANLDQVVNYLRTITGLNFFITAKVRQEKYDEVVVNLSLDDVTVRTVLDLVTEPYEIKWEPRDGVVTIATRDEVRGEMVIRYFDVKDLNVAIRDFVGQEINLVPSNFVPPEPPDLPEPAPIFPADSLVDLIRETIGDQTTWEDPATIDTRNGIIIARNVVPILNQVEALLDELRRNSGLLVNLEVRFMTAQDNFLRDVGVDLRGLGDDSQGIGLPGLGTNAVQDDQFFGTAANPYGVPFGIFPEPSSVGTSNDSGLFYNDGSDGAYSARVENLYDIMLGNPDTLTNSGGLSFQHVYIDDAELEVILRAVEKSERIQQITAARITVYNTQRANISVLNQVSYVQDYEVEIAQASNIANPVIQTIQDGVVLDVRPVVSADRRFVTLEMRPTVAILTRPIATFSTSLASGPVTASAPVVIQIPELQVSRVRTTVIMPDGGTLLLGGLKFYEKVNQTSSVPFLQNVPIANFLFSRRGTFTNRRNLLVLVTAEIVDLDEREPKDNLVVPAPLPTTWEPMREDPAAEVAGCGAPPPPCGCAPAQPIGRFDAPPAVRSSSHNTSRVGERSSRSTPPTGAPPPVVGPSGTRRPGPGAAGSQGGAPPRVDR